MNLPILFIIFNRPDIALRSFRRIKEIKPQKIFIASDGPRLDVHGETKVVEHTRQIILSEIDWDCEVNTLFQDENLGCGKGVYTAIDWFFSQVEYGVILEDDCVAEQSFFQYAQDLLEEFKNDQRVGMIAGTAPVILSDYPYSIIFSKYKSCWGWASWRRAWVNMDLNMKWRMSPQSEDILCNSGYRSNDIKIWKNKIEYINKGYVSAWDWQWYFSLSSQNQLCIYPKFNQISNIGDDEQATHTSFSDITFKTFPLEFPLCMPKYVVPNFEFDKKFYNRSITFVNRISRILPHTLKQTIKRLIKKFK